MQTLWSLSISITLLFIGCKEEPKTVFRYISPQHDNIQLVATSDTLLFPLGENSYNSTRSVNYFTDKGTEYLAIYDKQSVSINLYDFRKQKMLRHIPLKEILPYRKLSKHTTMFYKNTDSLYVINGLTLYLLDGALAIKDSIDFLTDPYTAYSSFGTGYPPVFLNNKMYTAAAPILNTKKSSEYKKWKAIYEIDWKNKGINLRYPMPQEYKDSLFGYYFFDVSYCINDKGRLVVSFPADSNIYETDMQDYNVAYLAKSIYQKGNIQAVTNEEMSQEMGMYEGFLVRDSYGKIFFDPNRKIYLRVAEQKISEGDFLLGKKEKDKSIIFFDEDMRIIGESMLDKNITLNTVFFTGDGKLYARTKVRDENGIYFVRLTYQNNSAGKSKLALNK